jgi:hypothetical protein
MKTLSIDKVGKKVEISWWKNTIFKLISPFSNHCALSGFAYWSLVDCLSLTHTKCIQQMLLLMLMKCP